MSDYIIELDIKPNSHFIGSGGHGQDKTNGIGIKDCTGCGTGQAIVFVPSSSTSLDFVCLFDRKLPKTHIEKLKGKTFEQLLIIKLGYKM